MIYPLGTVIFNSYVEEPESATPKKMQKSVSFQDANMCELDDVCVYIYIDIDIDIYIYLMFCYVSILFSPVGAWYTCTRCFKHKPKRHPSCLAQSLKSRKYHVYQSVLSNYSFQVYLPEN